MNLLWLFELETLQMFEGETKFPYEKKNRKFRAIYGWNVQCLSCVNAFKNDKFNLLHCLN